MTITLASEAFEPPVNHTLLISIFRYAVDGRHRVLAELGSAQVSPWLEMQSPNVRDEINFAVDWSAESEALEPSATRVTLGNYQQNNWTTNPVQIRIDQARAFLERSFSIVLEDAVSDKAFLFKMLTQEERDFISKQLTSGFLRIDHGGGLQNMRKKITDLNADPSSRYRTWVLFDSDALRPGFPSNHSELLRENCESIPHHQLQRRYIESYLPSQALNTWAKIGHGRDERTERFAQIEAFLRMKTVQRHHFNLKDGFSQDAKRTDASAGDLYDDVNQNDQATLAHGLSRKIRDLFEGEYVTEGNLRADKGWSELRPVITRLLAELR